MEALKYPASGNGPVPGNETPDTRSKASLLSLTLNLITGALGAGILSVPWGMAGASLIGSTVITFVVLALNTWTNMILVSAADERKKFNLGSLLSEIPGSLGSAIRAGCEVMIYMSRFGCLVGYMIIVADSMSPLFDAPSLWPFSSRSFWVTSGSLLVFPLCFLPQKYLSISSSLCIAVNVYVVGLLFYLFMEQGPSEHVCMFGVAPGFITMTSATMQGVTIQMCVLPMYQELERHSPRRFRLASMISFGFVFFIFIGFAALGYLVYGSQVQSNILNDLPHTLSGDIARGGMVLVVAGVYPIMMQPMIAPVRESVKLRGRGNARVHLTIFMLVFGAMGVAYCVTDLGMMNTINGSLGVFFFVGLAPGMVGIFLLYRGDALRRNMMIGLIVACFVVSVVGFFYLANEYASLIDSCSLWVGKEQHAPVWEESVQHPPVFAVLPVSRGA